MKNDISFGIIGGDIRQVYLAEAITILMLDSMALTNLTIQNT